MVTYNASLVALLAHYGSAPRACQPYRAKTKGKVERPFRYIRQDFFLGRSFHDCVFRKVPDSDSGKSRTVISESPGQAFR